MERAGAVPGLLWSVLESTNFIESVSDAERIRTAIEWQFDADISNNETVAFLQRCIGLEAILGDDEQSRAIPITEKLADRYAYLLGKTASERKQLKDEFVLVYRKRSDLVHARRSQLTAGDRVVVDGARTILSKIIMNEVHWLVRRNRPS